MDKGKTEREVTACAAELLQRAGYRAFVPGHDAGTGRQGISDQPGKVCAGGDHRRKTPGRGRAPEHCPHRLAPAGPEAEPLYESADLALLKTHYYGGVRKYQWPTIPLALHGVAYKKDGTRVEICVGEEPGDPVFCITDLLPHLGAEQNDRKLAEGVKAEELNIVVGSLPYEEKELKNRVKLLTMQLLHQKYGITERDFQRAEIEAVPAQNARDVGFDRGLIGAYGQDDRIDAYPALMAEIEAKAPAFTTVCVLTDKEEIGSDGVTGLASMYVFHFLQQLCAAQGRRYRLLPALEVPFGRCDRRIRPHLCQRVRPPQNSTYAGKGVAIAKYTGARGRAAASDASAELVSYFTRLFDAAGVVCRWVRWARWTRAAAAPLPNMWPARHRHPGRGCAGAQHALAL